jgi:hypothetical protein
MSDVPTDLLELLLDIASASRPTLKKKLFKGLCCYEKRYEKRLFKTILIQYLA